MRILVKVRTSRPSSRIVAEEDGILLVDLRARPEKGEANRELIKLLEKHYGGKARIIKGLKSRLKVVEIS